MVQSACVIDLQPVPLPDGGDPAIDRQHLSRMTLGERTLEREVLELFARQTDILLPRIRDGAPAVAAALAHTLKGSARGIGAWRVARAAEAVEHNREDDLTAALDALGAAIAETKVAIARILLGR